MTEDPLSAHDSVLGGEAELELLTRDDATQMVTDLVQLIEAKALAQRLAFKVLVQELSAAASPEVAFRVQTRLNAVRWEMAILTHDEDSIRGNVAQELSLLIEELDSLVTRA